MQLCITAHIGYILKNWTVKIIASKLGVREVQIKVVS